VSGIVVIGATGGCGATTLACGVALERAQAAEPVLVVDLDAHGGGPSALWGIPATRALDDLRDLGDGLGPDHLAHLVHRHPTGIDVMAGARTPAALTHWSAVPADAFAAHVAARSCWVADAGRGDTALAAALAARADLVVIVAPRTVHGAARAVAAMGEGHWRRAACLASHLPAGERVSERTLSRALGLDVIATAPCDDRAAARVAAAQPARGRGLARAVAAIGAIT
jgi:hypothetical protein